MRTAILSSSRPWAEPLLRELAQSTGDTVDAALLRQLAFLIGRDDNHDARTANLLNTLADSAAASNTATLHPILLGLADGLRGAKTSLQKLRPTLPPAAAALVERAVNDAAKAAADEQAPVGERVAAIQVLSCGELDQALPVLAPLLNPHVAEGIERAAVQSLAAFDSPQVAAALIAPWRGYTPHVRSAVVQAIFSHPTWRGELLAAIERGDVAANQITRVERGMLLALPDKEMRLRAEKLFESDNSPRQEIYDRYRPVLQLAGTVPAGEKIYQRECMACHQVGKQGQAVGPNLAMTKHRAPEELLMHILDPNREVQPAYIQYSVIDNAGGIYSGLIAAETASSITLRRDKNVEKTILKSEIDEISSSEKSLMPEGFEKTIPPQEMADLLAFLKEMHYDIGTQPGRREGGK